MRTTDARPFTAATDAFAFAQVFTAPITPRGTRRHLLPRLRSRAAQR